MPRKIRQLIADLEHAGFIFTPGKGGHRKFTMGAQTVIISGQTGADAHHYQEKQVRKAIAAVQKKSP